MVEPEGFTCAIPFAPQQLRKLVKRERRRVWIDPEYLQGLLAGGYHRHATASPNEKPDWIEFIEVRRRK